MNENYKPTYTEEVTELEDRSLEVQFDFYEMGKKTANIAASERTPCEVWSMVIRLRSA
jgi:hypothetical protein